MRQATRIVKSPATLFVVLIAAALLLGPAYAGWLGPPAHPAIIGSVDLEKVFNEIGADEAGAPGNQVMQHQKDICPGI